MVTIVAWLKLLAALFGFGRQVADTVQSESDKSAGRSQERAATLERNAENVKLANEASVEATNRHKTMPGDEAFDQDFKRSD